jgi:hypothetical protein
MSVDFTYYFLSLLILFWNMKNIGKSMTGETDDEWSVMLDMLLGLDDDPYRYDDIIDNLWSFKIRNKRKKSEYVQFSTYSIQLLCLRKHFQEIYAYSDDEIVWRYNFYYN